MSEKEFNEREKRARKQPELKDNSAVEMFDAFLAELYHENYASNLLKQDPQAYRELLNQFMYEHSY
jgi:hypothetical protein